MANAEILVGAAGSRRQVVVLGTGGTIAGRASRPQDVVSYQAAQVGVADLLQELPDVGCELSCEQVAQINSKDMGWPVWRPLLARLAFHLARPEVVGVVVTHGTDTLEETAYLLHRVLKPHKPVVLTGAMRPASALVPDGPQNLVDALSLAQMPEAAGVFVAFAGEVHGPLAASKVHPYRLDAFDSGEEGPWACIENGAVRGFKPWPGVEGAVGTDGCDAEAVARLLAAPSLPRVELLQSHADSGADGLWAWLAQPLAGARALRGLVVAGSGNGNLHQDLLLPLRAAVAAGVRVWVCSRCPLGRVLPQEGAEFELCAGLSPAKARLALALDLLGL